ncbi:hypothetical protein BC829DRAFT_1193 [Chytridium lagenaria]|nr:hypothetical protein BC829DRAFT_1193 [Chytridium lagenaria]
METSYLVENALVSKNVFILASSGLFLLRKLISGNDSVIAIRSSLEGNLAGAVYAPENTFMKHSPNCLYPQISYIFWSFGDSALTALKTVVFSTLADVTNGVWSESRTARNFSLKDTTTFIDFERDHDTDSNLYLIGDPCGRTDLRRCGVGVSIIVENIVRGFRSSYSFPATLIFTGLSFHSNGVDVFAYGNELWHSIDRGLTWRKIFHTV